MKRATKEEVKAFSELEKSDAVDTIFSYWRNHGFPHYKSNMGEREKELKLLANYDRSGMINSDNQIKQTMHGLGVAWNYFPHHWNVATKGRMTVLDVWNDDDLFKNAIARRLNRGGLAWDENGNPHMTISIIRKALMACSPAQRVSNFRPTAAASIYDQYAGDGIVWDMSCGYGGRLLGAMVSGKVKKYIGTEPCKETFSGLEQMAEDWSMLFNTRVELHRVGSEDFTTDEEVDLCFTSPPYFNTEIYSHEDSQSWKRYQTVEEWNSKFLAQTIANCWESLKEGGHMILNVANVKTHQTLEEDTIELATLQGFMYVKTLALTLSSINTGAFKYEPVFVFVK